MQEACVAIGKEYNISGTKSGTTDLRADLIEAAVNARGLGHDAFLQTYGSMVTTEVRDEMAALRLRTLDGANDEDDYDMA